MIGFFKKNCWPSTKYGGANSHMAIRANELGIPSVIGAGDQFYDFWVKYNFLSIDCSKKKLKYCLENRYYTTSYI